MRARHPVSSPELPESLWQDSKVGGYKVSLLQMRKQAQVGQAAHPKPPSLSASQAYLPPKPMPVTTTPSCLPVSFLFPLIPVISPSCWSLSEPAPSVLGKV